MEYVTVQGEELPALGFGTYKLSGETCVHAVMEALRVGYRHIDTAEMYGNHAEVGQAIEQSDVDRDDVFLTTKIWRTNLAHNQVLQSLDESLDALGMDYVDLLLIHWPSRSVPVEETIDAMNQLQQAAKVRHIGVSNFSVSQLKGAIAASTTPIFTNQIEYHPLTRQDEVLEFCLDNDILVTAYSPLAKGKVSSNQTLQQIGDRYDKTAAQVALRWLLQQPMVAPIPKAGTRNHIHENFDVFDFELTNEEMNEIFDLHGGLLDQLRRKIGL